jgi:hypothetical protein
MCQFVASHTQCNQVLFRVAARSAPESEMVYLQLLPGAAVLTTPPIAFQYLPVKPTVLFRVESEPGFRAKLVHVVLPLTSERKSARC